MEKTVEVGTFEAFLNKCDNVLNEESGHNEKLLKLLDIFDNDRVNLNKEEKTGVFGDKIDAFYNKLNSNLLQHYSGSNEMYFSVARLRGYNQALSASKSNTLASFVEHKSQVKLGVFVKEFDYLCSNPDDAKMVTLLSQTQNIDPNSYVGDQTKERIAAAKQKLEKLAIEPEMSSAIVVDEVPQDLSMAKHENSNVTPSPAIQPKDLVNFCNALQETTNEISQTNDMSIKQKSWNSLKNFGAFIASPVLLAANGVYDIGQNVKDGDIKYASLNLVYQALVVSKAAIEIPLKPIIYTSKELVNGFKDMYKGDVKGGVQKICMSPITGTLKAVNKIGTSVRAHMTNSNDPAKDESVSREPRRNTKTFQTFVDKFSKKL